MLREYARAKSKVDRFLRLDDRGTAHENYSFHLVPQ